MRRGRFGLEPRLHRSGPRHGPRRARNGRRRHGEADRPRRRRRRRHRRRRGVQRRTAGVVVGLLPVEHRRETDADPCGLVPCLPRWARTCERRIQIRRVAWGRRRVGSTPPRPRRNGRAPRRPSRRRCPRRDGRVARPGSRDERRRPPPRRGVRRPRCRPRPVGLRHTVRSTRGPRGRRVRRSQLERGLRGNGRASCRPLGSISRPRRVVAPRAAERRNRRGAGRHGVVLADRRRRAERRSALLPGGGGMRGGGGAVCDGDGGGWRRTPVSARRRPRRGRHGRGGRGGGTRRRPGARGVRGGPPSGRWVRRARFPLRRRRRRRDPSAVRRRCRHGRGRAVRRPLWGQRRRGKAAPDLRAGRPCPAACRDGGPRRRKRLVGGAVRRFPAVALGVRRRALSGVRGRHLRRHVRG